MSIKFTQFLMPDGRRTPVTIDRPDEIEALAEEVIKGGGSFEIEVLSTGVVSITCEDHGREETLAHELCENGPPVPAAVDRVVREAARVLGQRN
jgi:hypothetical protein